MADRHCPGSQVERLADEVAGRVRRAPRVKPRACNEALAMLADKGVSVEPDETENKVTDRLLLFAKGLTRAIKTTYVMVNRDDEGSTFTLVDPAALGLLIRAVRIAAGLSQHDAAELCGVSAPFLIGVERGKPTAQIGRVLQVCAGLGIRLETRGPTPLPRDLSQAPKRKPRSRKPR